MIATFSQRALNSGILAAVLSEMAFLKTWQEGYVILLSEAQKLLAEDEELAAVALPATVDEMREKEEDVLVSIMEPLSQLRSRVGGDVLPLTIFMMTLHLSRNPIHCVRRQGEAVPLPGTPAALPERRRNRWRGRGPEIRAAVARDRGG